MKTKNLKTRRSHPLLVWMVLLLAMTNVAVFLEAGRYNTVVVAATDGQIVATSGDPTLYFASMAATIGSGLIILGAAVVWVINFAKQVAKPESSVQTAAKSATKTTKKTAQKAVKTAKADAKKAISNVKSGAKKAGKAAQGGVKKAEKAVKKTAGKVKKTL